MPNTARSGLLLCLTFLSLFLLLTTPGCRHERKPLPLSAWGLPVDLTSNLEHIEVLRLPQEVTRIDWLPKTLKVLLAGGTAIKTLEGLPEFLNVLDVSNTEIDTVENLPGTLAELNISNTHIQDLNGLPALYSLTIGGAYINNLQGLPDSLRELNITGSNVASLDGLPSRLESLNWEGDKLKRLGRLPSTLKALTLRQPDLKELDPLPHNLQYLEIQLPRGLRPTELGLEALPPFLVRLRLEGGYAPDLHDLSYIRLLDLSDPRLLGSKLPASLSRLSLSGKLDSVSVPSSVGALTLDCSGATSSFKAIPKNLRSLELQNCANESLGKLPTNLRELTVGKTKITNFTNLPDSLEKLTVEATLNTGQPILLMRLPNGLTSLSLRGLQIGILPALPGSLKQLDLSGSTIVHMDTLPPHLEALILQGTTITSAEGFNLAAIFKELPLKEVNLAEISLNQKGIKSPDPVTLSMDELPALPKGLEVLRLGAGQVNHLGKLPATVRVLEFISQ